MTVTHNDNESIIGRAEINDIDAILAIPPCDPNEIASTSSKNNADTLFTWDYSLGRPAVAQVVREGQGRPVERFAGSALGDRGRRREDDHRGPGAARDRPRSQRVHRHAGREVGRQEVARVRHREPQLVAQPVPARRAGRADLHGQDRRDGAVVRRQVVRQHPGRRRGQARRGLRPLSRRRRWVASTRSTRTCGCCSTTSSATAVGT